MMHKKSLLEHRATLVKRLLFLSSALVVVLWVGWLQWVIAAHRAISLQAVLVSADRVSATLKSGGGKLVVEYQYRYEGTDYVGSQVTFGGFWFGHQASSDSEQVSMVDRLRIPRPQQQVQIWVDPNNPSDSALLKRAHPGMKYVTLFVALALSIGVLSACMQIRKLAMKKTTGMH